MPEIELDTTCANGANICFGGEMLLSTVDTKQVFIPIGIRNFHIVDTSILFFFCLKNIDTHGIDLNNITNQLICPDGKNSLILANGDNLVFCQSKQPDYCWHIFYKSRTLLSS